MFAVLSVHLLGRLITERPCEWVPASENARVARSGFLLVVGLPFSNRGLQVLLLFGLSSKITLCLNLLCHDGAERAGYFTAKTSLRYSVSSFLVMERVRSAVLFREGNPCPLLQLMEQQHSHSGV